MKTGITGPTQTLSAQQQLPLEAVELVAVEGPGKGARQRLEAGTLIAGSSSRAQLSLDDPAVSRRHASFELLPGAVRLRDLGSRNGCSWLGARVENAILPIGTRVTLGRTVVHVRPLAAPKHDAVPELAGLVTRSAAMRQLAWRLSRVAATDVTVVLVGPTGSGKEAVARSLHALSQRAAGPFAVFDAGATSEALFESELFGHRRGAFTGAVGDHPGAAESAEGGTLLLDNVDHVPLPQQTRLLRFLEERTVKPIGAPKAQRVDVRVLATAQAPLEDAVTAGRLRQDLFFRLSEVVLEVPALSRRLEDIPELAATFAREVSGLDVKLSRTTLAALQAHPWPGNARELKNAVTRSLAFGAHDAEPEAVEGPTPPPADLKKARARVVDSFESDFLRALLLKHGWNVSAAAKDAKMARSHFYTLITRHGLRRE